jgi:hypothetical protein
MGEVSPAQASDSHSPVEKRPCTPDQSQEDKRGTVVDEVNEFRRLYLLSKSGEGTVSHTSYVELGVGWTVDPEYPVGRRVLVFCSREEKWLSCTVIRYDECKACHELQLDTSAVTREIPLMGVKVRFLMRLGEKLPPPPNISRMFCTLETLRNCIKSGTYDKGLLPGIRRGVRKLQEAVWQEAYCFANGGSVCLEEDQECILDLVRSISSDKKAQQYQDILGKQSLGHMRLLTLPRWIESTTFLPADIAWMNYRGQHWPCLIVSSDHYMDLHGGGQGTLVTTRIFHDANEKKIVCVYYFGTHERQLVRATSLEDFAVGLQKGRLKLHRSNSKKKPSPLESSMEEVVEFLRTGTLSGGMQQALTSVNGWRASPGEVNASFLVPSAAKARGVETESIDNVYENINEENNMAAIGFSRHWQPTKSFLESISDTKNGFRVLCLGRVIEDNPNFHNENYVWCASYKVERKMKSCFAEDRAVWHRMEILSPTSKTATPMLRVSISQKEVLRKSGASQEVKKFISSASISKSNSSERGGGLFSMAGARLLGLNKSLIRELLFMLPGAQQCKRISLKTIQNSRESLVNRSKGNPLLHEMECCQLPEGMEPVPMQHRRPFECQVCGDVEEDAEDLILQCDGCKSCVHMSCYSVSEAPHGSLWLCDVCQVRPKEEHRPACILCPIKEGVMKRTIDGQWCHPACAIWIPETHILRDETHLSLRGLIEGVRRISRSRLTNTCMFCQLPYGAVIQCCTDQEDCQHSFHYMCAKSNHCDLKIELQGHWEEPTSNHSETGEHSSFPKHGTSEEQSLCIKCEPLIPGASNKDSDGNVPCDGCGQSQSAKNSERGENGEKGKQKPDTACKPKKKIGKKRKRQTDPKEKGTAVGNSKLMAFCPKHSGTAPKKYHGSTNLNHSSESIVEIDSRTFPGQNVVTWMKYNRYPNNKSAYVEGLALDCAGPTPAGTISVDYTCTSRYDGLSSKTEIVKKESTSVKTTIVSLDPTKMAHPGILSMGDQYARLQQNWRKDIHPGKSKIHGWGAFPTRKICRGEMVIEYVGELVRPTYAEIRETKLYDELVGAGTYVFRLNSEFCVDATRSGNLAHLLNHSCTPNCASRTITVKKQDGRPEDYVVIFALQDIAPGEELTYDYRFSGEEVLHCSCGSAQCRGQVNQPVSPSLEACYARAEDIKPVTQKLEPGRPSTE